MPGACCCEEGGGLSIDGTALRWMRGCPPSSPTALQTACASAGGECAAVWTIAVSRLTIAARSAGYAVTTACTAAPTLSHDLADLHETLEATFTVDPHPPTTPHTVLLAGPPLVTCQWWPSSHRTVPRNCRGLAAGEAASAASLRR